ncbi:Cytoskeleton associated protein CAP Gly [Paragonimus heterotremus]|uniref:Cytoskeleton associated protein CAP Gly n=1 Tax=Paragonimus heterotremus TaxID=100268 RepID=A0A8J4WEY5_9TREM|nr:Cytoskeleton associated protein CAP Gly [Paragonimus heterotremus]
MSYISLLLTSNASKVKCEKRYPSDLTLAQLKDRLVLVTGCDNNTMKIEVFDKEEQSKGWLSDDSQTLAALGLTDGMHLHVTDPNVADGTYDKLDESTELYQMSAEDYEKRDDTVLAWMKRNKLGQFREVDHEEAKRAEEERQRKEREEQEKAESLPVGSRCEVRVPSQPTKRGKIAFVGKTKFKPGFWVGVHYDEPLGRNDGSVDGVRYFECPDKYGAFVKPQCVTAGDFPELGIDELDEI